MRPTSDDGDREADPAEAGPEPADHEAGLGGSGRDAGPDEAWRRWVGRLSDRARRDAGTLRDTVAARSARLRARARGGAGALREAVARQSARLTSLPDRVRADRTAAAERRAADRKERTDRKVAEQATQTARREAERAGAIAQREAEAAREQARQRALALAERQRLAVARDAAARRHYRSLLRKDRYRRSRRRRVLVAALLTPIVLAAGVVALGLYVDSVPLPPQLPLPEATTVYYNDGVTPIVQLGEVNRTILEPTEINDAVKQAIVAAEDRTFWTNSGVDARGVVRAAWNNAAGGQLQGASTITQQYARLAAGLRDVTYARKTREAVLAWKLDRSYSKDEILAFYLNTIPFGRGAYGIEAAAQTFFGKTARRDAPADQQVTVAEAMLLATLVRQPEPDPADPDRRPGYDPARGGVAAANSLSRWEYVRDGMVELGYLTPEQAQALQYPTTVRAIDADPGLRTLQGPTGLVVAHALSELRQREPFRGKPADYLSNGGFHIVTTLDPRLQADAEASADIRRPTAPDVVRGQPSDWQAALVAVEPGTGRVLAYYGGNDGTGADYAGWYYDASGDATGYGEHPPGSSFKVYDLAEALRQGIGLSSRWDSPAVKEFPESGRTYGTPAGPVRSSSSAQCQPDCTLWEATVASLNVPFFDLTEKLGPPNVIDMAHNFGIDALWTANGQRIDLGPDANVQGFTPEVGIGQYGVTVLDHADGMATFAAGGMRAAAHFVREVTYDGVRVYAEPLTQTQTGLTKEQVDEITWVLGQVPSAQLDNGWDAAGKTGTWQAGDSETSNAHAWMVGYTGALAAAVWLGTTDGSALITSDGSDEVYGSTHPAAIWRQFMASALADLELDPARYRFEPPATVPAP